MIHILLINQTELISIGLENILKKAKSLYVVGYATSLIKAKNKYRNLSPDILLIDDSIFLKNKSSSKTINRIYNNTKIIVLCTNTRELFINQYLNNGARGFILPDDSPNTIIRAINTVIKGDIWLSQDIINSNLLSNNSYDTKNIITLREMDVLNLLAEGFTNSQIALKLSISKGTVKNHLVNIYHKLNIHSKVEAVNWLWNYKIEKER